MAEETAKQVNTPKGRAIMVVVALVVVLGAGAAYYWFTRTPAGKDCASVIQSGFRPIATDAAYRFQGKVQEDTAGCRGGETAKKYRSSPWVDWTNYWGTGDSSSKSNLDLQTQLGVYGALTDLEYQRIELVAFNRWDNAGTYKQFMEGKDGVPGGSVKVWPEMRLPKSDPHYQGVGGDGEQVCTGELIRFRNVTGICNDVRNPAMGATHRLFSRMVAFDTTYPDLEKNELAKNRHGGRLGLLQPDPQVISRKLFTRLQTAADKCQSGQGLPGDSKNADCDYLKANSFNVLAAFWIQFMNHDWFSHLDEGHNAPQMMETGCRNLSADEAKKLGCRPEDRMDKAFIADNADPEKFDYNGKSYLSRSYKTTQNNVTGWFDGSQLYGYDEDSRKRVKRDPKDRAKFLLVQSYLPILQPGDPMNPQWAGQESTAFPDNWSIGLSFFHNVFAREHNSFVTAFRKQAAATPDADCGLRNPSNPSKVIRYRDVTDDELFEIGRLVVAAEIAKIHTIEWTTQLLYDEPLYLGMNANWSGLLGGKNELATKALREVVAHFGESTKPNAATWYSVFASGPGIIGLGSTKPGWDMGNPDDVNGGTKHFGAPFNFPEEFITVYRLHPLVPDLIEFRQLNGNPNVILKKVPLVNTARGLATAQMHSGGLENWALSMGRQRSGRLTLRNHPLFLQNLTLPRLNTATKMVDVPALDILRDRERGVTRFNEFRRQMGLRQLTSFDDFVDPHLAAGDPARAQQESVVQTLRELYGQHKCDAHKVITDAQVNEDGTAINDCLGHPDGSTVDNIEDVDAVVGWLAEYTRPHGFIISETQFQLFIVNASRRLFSDRFFTSSFRPEFYTTLGFSWVNDNGPDGKVMEKGTPNGHTQEVSPLKRILLRTVPELSPELENVVNVFDPWARDRGKYYELDWKPRADAENDEAFKH
ncbi:MAG TPA: peroxidase family protein [Candidatus Angelobacter sp.]